MQTPRNLAVAKQHRIEDLKAVVNDPNASTLRQQSAQRELDQIDALGYAWPSNTGWPVAGQYDDDEQQRRIAQAG